MCRPKSSQYIPEIRQPTLCGHFLLRNFDFTIIEAALNRSVPGQNLPNTNVRKVGKAAAMNSSPAYHYSTNGVAHCAGKPIDSARLITTF